jgi:4-carboxymuconolactone decarboxylase
MRPEIKTKIQDLLAHSDEITEDIEAMAEEMLGTVPFILSILSERPEAFIFNTLGDFYTGRPRSMDERTAELVTIAAATALKSEACLKVHIAAAMKAGATRDEVLDAILIAALLGRTSILAPSLRIFKNAAGGDEGI